jgi:hypothetical protein
VVIKLKCPAWLVYIRFRFQLHFISSLFIVQLLFNLYGFLSSTNMVARTPTTVSPTSYANLRIIRVDGAGDVTLDLVFKDMTVGQLKRSITSTLRRPAYMWEDLNLYHLGVVMRNGIYLFPPLKYLGISTNICDTQIRY